jgi:hypothetical protein
MDMIYAMILIVLCVVNVLQFWLSARERQLFIDKLMSRDFAEYTRLTKPKSTSPRIEPDFEDRPPQGFVI